MHLPRPWALAAILTALWGGCSQDADNKPVTDGAPDTTASLPDQQAAPDLLDMALPPPDVCMPGCHWDCFFSGRGCSGGKVWSSGRGAVPCALFALGATMAGYRIAGDLKDSVAITALKLGLHPLLVWLLATEVFAVSPLHTAVATIVAALPVGVNVFILARAYDTYVRRSASAVLISTALSVLTTGLVLAQFAPGP